MVADNWINRNPFISKLLFAALTILGSFAVVKATWVREDSKMIQSELEKKVSKSDYSVDISEINNKIEGKADKKEHDNLEVKVETMRKEWREDQKEILTLIRNLPKK